MRHGVESIHYHTHIHNNINRLTGVYYTIIVSSTKRKILINQMQLNAQSSFLTNKRVKYHCAKGEQQGQH